MRPTKESGEILEKYVELSKKLGRLLTIRETEKLICSARQITNHFDSFNNLKELALNSHPEIIDSIEQTEPKVLLFDIETAPMQVYTWGLGENFVTIDQIIKDWHVLSYAAKWLDKPDEIYKRNRQPQVFYQGQKNAPAIEDDKKILEGIWKLLDEADIVITQNGIKFDQKKLFARFQHHGMKPPSSFRHIDMYRVSKKLGLTSHKLEFMTDKFCKRYKKLKHKKFPGLLLWKECLKNNKEAWNEMETYNKYDVLSLEELFYILIPWTGGINFNIYNSSPKNICKCGSENFVEKGFYYTDTGKYRKFLCKKCGSESRGKTNLLTKDKKDSLMMRTNR